MAHDTPVVPRNELREKIAKLAGGHFVNTIEMGVLKTFIDFKVFDAIPDQGHVTFAEIASKVGGEEEIIERFARYLIAADILDSTIPGSVAHTENSRIYRTGEIPSGFLVHIFNMLFRPVAQLPAFFAQHGLASPKDAAVTPMGLAMGHPDKDVYQIMQAEPEFANVYNGFVKRAAQMYSLDGVYDFAWLKASLNGTRLAVVDIGGNAGMALLDILQRNEYIPRDKAAVFDLPNVIEGHRPNLDPGLSDVQMIGGSMLQPFPAAAKGALIYQFRRVLNDFPDSQVAEALKWARQAALPDTRVLIVEEMLHEKPSRFQVAQDLTFMCVGGKRRNATMYSKLAEPAGFRLNAHYKDTTNDCGVLEFVVA